MLVIFRGLPGTGKSHLVRRLVRKAPGWLVLSRDALRASIVPHPSFSPEEKALIDDLIIVMAGHLLDQGRDVVIDGMALSSARRVEEFVQVAAARSAPVRIIECVCSEAMALARIARDKGGHPAGDRGEKLYFEVKARFQAITHPFLAVDTERDTAVNLSVIADYIKQ
ncbi:MAG: ATP-binding protein [Spirochaetia bacterium]|jgi:predicted kinase